MKIVSTTTFVARFGPEAWINDNAVPVDPEGPTTWNCTRSVLDDPAYWEGEAAFQGNWASEVIDRSDVLKDDPDAPQWVRDYGGPCTITVIKAVETSIVEDTVGVPDDVAEYLVTWSMPIEAESPVDAAQQALGIHRNPESIATVFFVEVGTRKFQVDLHSDGTVNSQVDVTTDSSHDEG